jgi:hypothetical protein
MGQRPSGLIDLLTSTFGKQAGRHDLDALADPSRLQGRLNIGRSVAGNAHMIAPNQLKTREFEVDAVCAVRHVVEAKRPIRSGGGMPGSTP